MQPLTPNDAPRIRMVAEATWGAPILEDRLFLRCLRADGALLLGATVGTDLIGYAMGYFTTDGAEPTLFSHMLAVLPAWRSHHVGRALKHAQRRAAAAAHATAVRWTFDPLRARNAHFNLEVLGASADRFHVNCYGEMTDVLNRGDRSDRLVVRWPVADEPRVDWDLRDASRLLARSGARERPEPRLAVDVGGHVALVEIPSDYASLRNQSPDLAAEWRNASATALSEGIARGRTVRAFLSDSTYVLSR